MSAAQLRRQTESESSRLIGRDREASFDIDRIHGALTVDVAQLAHVVRRLLDGGPGPLRHAAKSLPAQATPHLHLM